MFCEVRCSKLPRPGLRTAGRCYPCGVSETKSFIVVLAVVVFIIWVASVLMQPRYPQATGIFPQVVSCVQENSPHSASDPHWQPTLRVKVEPVRDPGRVREYRVLGCRFYYYHRYFR
jgi:hypothetical protein